MVRKVLAERFKKLRKATGKQMLRHPENCVDMRFGKGERKGQGVSLTQLLTRQSGLWPGGSLIPLVRYFMH